MRAFTALFISLGLAACVSIPEPAAGESDDCVDADNDGYLPAGCASRVPADCAPDDPTIHPGALDLCGNEIDEDCVDSDLVCTEAIAGNIETDLGAPGITSGVLAIANGQANVHFDADQGFTISHLSSPALDSENLLYTGPMEERLVGSHMWQDSFSWSPQSRSITRLASGPAAHRFSVSFTATGPQAATTIIGRTTYSVFPDGRIHRAEELTPEGTADFLSSYVALDPARFTHRLRPDDGSPLALLSESEMQTNNFNTPFEETDSLPAGSTCAYNGGVSRHELLGFAWNVYETQPNGGFRLPQTMFQGAIENHQFGFVYDWQRSGPVVATYGGAFQMIVGTTLSAVPATPCISVEGDAQAFLEPGQIAGATIDTETIGDHNGDGYNEDGGFYQISADGTYQLAVQFPEGSNAGFGRNTVLRVAAVPSTYPVILLDGNVLSHGRDYLLQFESDESIWLFLNVPVEGASLRIEFP